MMDESSLASTRQMQSFLEKIGPQDRVLLTNVRSPMYGLHVVDTVPTRILLGEESCPVNRDGIGNRFLPHRSLRV